MIWPAGSPEAKSAYNNHLRAVRRLAATKGYTLKKILGDDIVTVLSCETCDGACKATTFELDRGHWRGRFLAFEGTLTEVDRWLNEAALV